MIDAPSSSSAASATDDPLAVAVLHFSSGLLAQLAFCFVLSPFRADPFVVGPLVALYALRESDRRAMMLFIALSVAAVPLDFGFVFSGGEGSGSFFVKILAFAKLALTILLIYPAVKAHDALPAARPDRTLIVEANKAEMQQRVQETVAAALREELQKLAAPRPSGAHSSTTTAAGSVAAPASAAGAAGPTSRPAPVEANGSWDDV